MFLKPADLGQISAAPLGGSGQPLASSGAAIANGEPLAAPGRPLELLKKTPSGGVRSSGREPGCVAGHRDWYPDDAGSQGPSGACRSVGGGAGGTRLRHRLRARSSTRSVAARKYDAPMCVCSVSEVS